MAKQKGKIPITGTFGNIIWYVSRNQGLVRTKGSLDKKQMEENPKCAEILRNAQRMGRAATLSSDVYQQLPKEKRKYGNYQHLKVEAFHLLRSGATEDQTIEALKKIKW